MARGRLRISLLQFAEAENVTQIVLGASRRGRLASALRAGTGERTIKGSGPIDVHIVTHEEAAGAATLRLPHPSRGTGPRRFWSALAGAALLLPLLTVLLAALRNHLDLSSDLVIYLLAVVVVALIGGLSPALFAAVAAALLADYYFTTPVHSLAVERLNKITRSWSSSPRPLSSVRPRERPPGVCIRPRATSEARALSRLATAMMRGKELPALIEQIRENFGLTAGILLERDPEASPEPRWYVVAGAGDRPPEKPYEADVESPVDEDLTLAVRGSGLSTEDQRVLAACAAELGPAHTRGRITARAANADTLAASERTRASLLLAAGRDLRVPLHAADEALAHVGDLRGRTASQETARLLDTTRTAVGRATQLVTDLDELSRLHAGALDLYLRPVDLNEALDDLGPGGHTIIVRLPEQLPDAIADAALLTRVLTALGADALRHSPRDRPPVFAAEVQAGRLEIRVTDGCPDLGPDSPAQGGATGPRTAVARADSLALRLSRDLVEAMGGTFGTTTAGPAFVVALTLPSSAPGGSSAAPGRQE
ncbi:DUF4118 domain-containing protein [Streptomyces inhibens]|uniref:DUF4118 domain-containing protein n=1 Tax=Streptomyces inhibens TaxID=2293571 RepID=UPI001FCFE817|nr:DUF4118 domain-containing protein [Streptomyces inhibens]